jgi:hypothetical protein
MIPSMSRRLEQKLRLKSETMRIPRPGLAAEARIVEKTIVRLEFEIVTVEIVVQADRVSGRLAKHS